VPWMSCLLGRHTPRAPRTRQATDNILALLMPCASWWSSHPPLPPFLAGCFQPAQKLCCTVTDQAQGCRLWDTSLSQSEEASRPRRPSLRADHDQSCGRPSQPGPTLMASPALLVRNEIAGSCQHCENQALNPMTKRMGVSCAREYVPPENPIKQRSPAASRGRSQPPIYCESRQGPTTS
jgi:hypothetical protein